MPVTLIESTVLPALISMYFERNTLREKAKSLQIRTRKTLYLDTFHTVIATSISHSACLFNPFQANILHISKKLFKNSPDLQENICAAVFFKNNFFQNTSRQLLLGTETYSVKIFLQQH